MRLVCSAPAGRKYSSPGQTTLPTAEAEMKRFAWLVLVWLLASTLATSAQAAKARLRVVFLGAHCDDSEVCAGALMRMLADQGHEVISAYGTTFRRGRLCLGRPEDEVRRAESTAACKLLGATPHFFPYAHEELERPLADARTLNQIAKWLEQAKPDIVVTQWPIDSHPNHRSMAEAALAAYRHSGHVWGKEGQTPKSVDRGWNLYFYEASTLTKWDDWESLGFRPRAIAPHWVIWYE
jgi:LmbE family N-acetylglucosaminyl deacetylase